MRDFILTGKYFSSASCQSTKDCFWWNLGKTDTSEGIFFTPPPSHTHTKRSIFRSKWLLIFSLRVFIHFWRSYPTFSGIFWTLTEHSKINQNRISSFLVGKRQGFNCFAHFWKVPKIPEQCVGGGEKNCGKLLYFKGFLDWLNAVLWYLRFYDI